MILTKLLPQLSLSKDKIRVLLLEGVNDGPAHARQLTDMLGEMVAHVNLIPWNPADSREPFQPPARAAVRQFRRELERRGVAVTERLERGQEIAAACGQLAVQGG